MRLRLLYFLVAVLSVACVQDTIMEVSVHNHKDKVYASIGDIECETRVELNHKKQTVWNAGDNILIFADGYICEYTFDGKTGDRSGSFSYSKGWTYTNNGLVFDKYYAVHLAELKIMGFNDNSPAFLTVLPAVQGYKDSSYGVNTNAMLGSSSDGENFDFINLYGYLRLSLTGDKVVKSITVEGNDGETLAGLIYIHKSGYVGVYDNASATVTLDCGNGVQLTDEPTEFYFTLLPRTFKKGISVTVEFTDGSVFPKSTSKSIVLERNTIQPMKNFDTGSEVEWQTVTISHSGAVVSAPMFFGLTGMSGYIYWGDDYMSDINSTTSYVYDDGAESHTITVKAMNAQTMQITDCSGISVIDLSKF